jgi:hypothetical protein
VRGTLVVDVLKDGRIGGIEYLDRVLGHKVDLPSMMEAMEQSREKAERTKAEGRCATAA